MNGTLMRVTVLSVAATALATLVTGGCGDRATGDPERDSRAIPRPLACTPAGDRECWDPRPTTEPWQWQLQGRVDLSVPAPVYDVDMEVTPGLVSRIHAQGDHAICYVSVGTWEPFRADADEFPRSVLGRRLEGFESERWLDIRRVAALMPIMEERFDDCAAKGFDAVEPDNVDGYQNRSGFPLRPRDQLRYNARVANAVHARGMAVGLKNDLGQVDSLLAYFDFAVNEQCFQYRECGVLRRFIAANKPVYGAEYEVPRARFCDRSVRLGFSTIRKRYALGAFRRACASA
jgi:Glycoside-hydrolase family GH114